MEDFLKELFRSLGPEGSLPGDPPDCLLEELEIFFPRVWGPDFAPYLSHIPQDCQLHHCMITAALAASNLGVPN